MMETKPSATMTELGIVQAGATILAEPTRAFTLPAESDTATTVVDEMFAVMDRVARVHSFAKGMGLAAPQIGIDRRAAVVRPADPDAPAIVLLNPRIIDQSTETDEQYEGCLSFFDVRGLVPRPLHITVETTTLTGELVTTNYAHGLARLVGHEIDHLDGSLYRARMRSGIEPIPIEQYKQTGRKWVYNKQ
ncbi:MULTISPECIES: peptide deformylase [Nocardia]|uniref:Peptide deformylase n=1 Tax=Nocardia africana TaxID=134964 RepID=A0A378X4Z0_9NOCA|nr:peptide deformylase [Nocardia africana]MCC3317882.1 peptide deformylase [Nocardia africana]SUA48656.1 Peptide deformylase 2 [Nocardia africana]